MNTDQIQVDTEILREARSIMAYAIKRGWARLNRNHQPYRISDKHVMNAQHRRHIAEGHRKG
jgi:hypothetical protein